ncbi:MAG: CoA-binding protein, partial [Spirochaetales bacterium]|nr:CoA-binding protein [Spirochaetales bacterium]
MAGPFSSASDGTEDRSGLQRLFTPQGVAVLGSVKPGKIGHQLLTQLMAGGFSGSLYAVNPGAEAPAEYPAVQAFASVAAIPGTLDLALVAVPAAHAQAVVEECGARGVAAAVVFTSGFGEVGRLAEERALAETARRFGMRLVGPNCAGIMNTRARLFASIEVRALPGRAAFATQSGAVGGAVLALAETRGIGFSKFVSYGNRADVGEVELLDYLAADPDTDLIALYLESLQDGRAFMDAVRRAAGRKPVLLIKAGRSSSGLRAAGSHTGSLAGSDRVFQAMVRRSGALRVPGIEEMLDLCQGFASLPPPAGDRIAVVTNSGGPGILTS